MSCIKDLLEHKVTAVIRHATRENIQHVVEVLAENGIHNIEITVEEETGFGALEALQGLSVDCCIGAGSVLNIAQAKRAIAAGAKFIFSPILNSEVVAFAKANDIAIIPGVLTPNEIYQAISAGADAVKIFPINNMKDDYLKSIKAPLPSIPIIVTGGVNSENMSMYLKQGADGVGIGSNLVNMKNISEPDFYIDLAKRCQKYQI